MAAADGRSIHRAATSPEGTILVAVVSPTDHKRTYEPRPDRTGFEVALTEVGLSKREAARILGVSPSTIHRWLLRSVEPTAHARVRLVQLLEVLDRLADTLRPQTAHDWLFTPQPVLSHHKPVDLIEDRCSDVLSAVDQLGEGVFV